MQTETGRESLAHRKKQLLQREWRSDSAAPRGKVPPKVHQESPITSNPATKEGIHKVCLTCRTNYPKGVYTYKSSQKQSGCNPPSACAANQRKEEALPLQHLEAHLPNWTEAMFRRRLLCSPVCYAPTVTWRRLLSVPQNT